jgi:hypothetical protein
MGFGIKKDFRRRKIQMNLTLYPDTNDLNSLEQAVFKLSMMSYLK